MTRNRHICRLREMDISNKRVLIRVDYNVPFAASFIYDFRLHATLPTIDYILDQGGTIILITHIGRPTYPDFSLSTRHLMPWFIQRGYSIAFADDIEEARTLSKAEQHRLILLENIRFFPQERKDDLEFAKIVASLADIYVNDAFGTLHKKDTSVYRVPSFFQSTDKTIGFLVEKELHILDTMIDNPSRPFCLFMGGGKIRSKIPLLHALLDHIDALFLCPAIVFSFLYALKKPIGSSLIDKDIIDECKRLIEYTSSRSVKFYMPRDFIVSDDDMQGPFSLCSSEQIKSHQMGISIGPETVRAWSNHIMRAGTIFYNGLMGDIQYKESLTGSVSLFTAISASDAIRIITGGDSVSAIQLAGLSQSVDLLSTGGGACLTYIGTRSLVGLTFL